MKCAMGVPQGSVLAPLFFILMIFHNSVMGYVHVYADDTIVYTRAKS